MFTRQATQLQSALQGQFGNTPTAQDMIQALCNCAQTIEHRGPMQFEFATPTYGAFPGLAPPPGLASLPPALGGSPAIRTQAGPNFTFINPPPWQPIQWDPIPFVDWPAGSPFFAGDTYLPGWGGGNGSGGGEWGGGSWGGSFGGGGNTDLNFPPLSWPGPGEGGGAVGERGNQDSAYADYFAGGPHSMHVAGPSYIQNVDSRTITTQEFSTNQITNQGDAYTYGDTYIDGDTYIGGDTVHQGDTVHEGNTTHQKAVTSEGPVMNEGPVTNLGDEHHYGDNTFHNPITVITNGQPRQLQDLEVITAVGFDIVNNGDLRVFATIRNVTVFAAGPARQDARVRQPNENVTMVTDVTWDDANKKFVKTRRQYLVFGRPGANAVNTDVFLAQGAKFDPDTCEIVDDDAIPPEYTPVVAP